MKQQATGKKVISKNRKARHEYELLEIFEAGLVLTGTEIKSVRANRVSLARSYVQPRDGELWLVGANIAEYEHGNQQNHEPARPRKLLLHRREINKILDELAQKGLTAVPTMLYLKNGRAKLEFALARGKKLHDKRQTVAKRDSQRQVERALREKYR
ncbi:MAG: SsrA-binding protein SmpB [Ardenticatenaceae bacterium]|nr:SsrA-binding protein SmpB [Anaerolineales bacterium]MCB9007856.1 SsrA-binding protein SmpB [Ardenticatenaceae bacterium]